MNGSIASVNNATLATVAANYGLKTVVDQHSLEVDTKVANAFLGAVTAAALPPSLQAETPPSQGCRSPRQTPAP